MSSPVRTAVVGLGYWGPNLVRNLAEIDAAELVAVCDLDPERLALVGRRYPAVRRTTNVQDVIDADDVDAVVIATPVSTHHPLGMSALSAGKHVFIEKPLAASTRDAAELATTAAAAGTRPHARSHVSLQPAGRCNPRPGRLGRRSESCSSSRPAA